MEGFAKHLFRRFDSLTVESFCEGNFFVENLAMDVSSHDLVVPELFCNERIYRGQFRHG